MFKKTTLIITLLFVAILFYLANKFNNVSDFKFSNPKDVVPFYEAALDQFWLGGITIFFTSWIWVNVIALKSKQLFWFWIPLLFMAVVALTNSNQEEQLFHFKKANGLWNGGFSLSYFFGIGQVLIAAFLIIINYLGFKSYFLKNLTVKL